MSSAISRFRHRRRLRLHLSYHRRLHLLAIEFSVTVDVFTHIEVPVSINVLSDIKIAVTVNVLMPLGLSGYHRLSLQFDQARFRLHLR